MHLTLLTYVPHTLPIYFLDLITQSSKWNRGYNEGQNSSTCQSAYFSWILRPRLIEYYVNEEEEEEEEEDIYIYIIPRSIQTRH